MSLDVAVAGVDLGGSKIAGVLLDDDTGQVCGEIWHEHRVQGPAEAVRLIAGVVSQLAAAAEQKVTSVGVAIAAWLSRDRREVLAAANLGIRRAPLASLLRDRLGLPVLLENDGNATAYGEYLHGAGRSADVMLLLTLGTGVGGGIVRSGALVRGAHGLAGELGHLPVDRAGPACSCGGAGCLEVYASGTAVAAQARLAAGGAGAGAAAIMARAGGGPAAISARHVAAAAHAGDEYAAGLLAAAGRAAGQAVASVIPAVDPDLVVLSGSLAISAAQLILLPAQEELGRNRPLAGVLDSVPLVLGQAGAAAAALGAAELARRHPAWSRWSAPPCQGRAHR